MHATSCGSVLCVLSDKVFDAVTMTDDISLCCGKSGAGMYIFWETTMEPLYKKTLRQQLHTVIEMNTFLLFLVQDICWSERK